VNIIAVPAAAEQVEDDACPLESRWFHGQILEVKLTTSHTNIAGTFLAALSNVPLMLVLYLHFN
jgi:hypothetical protein